MIEEPRLFRGRSYPETKAFVIVLYRCLRLMPDRRYPIGSVLCINSLLCMALIIIFFVIYYLLCYMDYFIVLWIIPPILNESILWKYPLVSLGFVYIR